VQGRARGTRGSHERLEKLQRTEVGSRQSKCAESPAQKKGVIESNSAEKKKASLKKRQESSAGREIKRFGGKEKKSGGAEGRSRPKNKGKSKKPKPQ